MTAHDSREAGSRFQLGAWTADEIGLAATELASLGSALPQHTRKAWMRLAPGMPDSFYLSGGTALAVHLHHRESRDLDFFSERAFDANALSDSLSAAFDDFATTTLAEGTVNGVLAQTRVQFLDATSQRVLAAPLRFAGLRIASLGDLLATKIKVIGDRPELRDYYDLMTIEQKTSLSVELGIDLYRDKFERDRSKPSQVTHLVMSLGYFDDVEEDPGLPAVKAEIQKYWQRRQPEIVTALAGG